MQYSEVQYSEVQCIEVNTALKIHEGGGAIRSVHLGATFHCLGRLDLSIFSQNPAFNMVL